MTPVCDVLIDDPRWRERMDVESLVKSAVAKIITFIEPQLHPDAEASFSFSNDAHVRELNGHWRHKDAPTNVLSFPASGGADLNKAMLLGDVVLAYETIDREAAEQGKTFDQHTAHMVVHGFLHLIGFDHDSDDDALEMETVESRVLTGLGMPDPWGQE